MSTDPQPAAPAQSRRTRRAEPITKRTARNGAVSWEFRADVGVKPDGSRDRHRFTFRTYAEARRELRRITHEVAAGTYTRRTDITVDEACDQWLAGRRGVRPNTLDDYRNKLAPVRRYLGARKLQQLTKADADDLVCWMLTEGRRDTRNYRAGSLAGRVAELVGAHPEGITASAIAAAFPGADVHTTLAALLHAGRVARPRRGCYLPASPAGPAEPHRATAGVKPTTVRSALTAFGAVVQSFVDQGVLPRNVVRLVDRPADPIAESASETAKSWNVAEVETFIASVRGERLFACWLLSCYGLRRSEVLGLKWCDIDGDTLRIQRGRVVVGTGTVEGLPKSKRSLRNLPMPAELTEALRALRTRQKAEALALGVPWSDDRLIAVHEDGAQIRPEWYSDQFQRLRQRAGLRRIKLHGLRNTSVTLMLDQRHPVHIVAAWHGHDPAVSLSIYSDAKADELRAAGASLFG
ncbi:MAG TPA: site-specific integrase [Mycobacterium sp.]